MSKKMIARQIMSWMVFVVAVHIIDTLATYGLITPQPLLFGWMVYAVACVVAGILMYCRTLPNCQLKIFQKVYKIVDCIEFFLPISYLVYGELKIYGIYDRKCKKYMEDTTASVDDFLWYLAYRVITSAKRLFQSDLYTTN